jgi:hypothetical protein
VEDKSCRRWLRRGRYNGVAGAFAAICFAVLPSVLRSRSLHFQAKLFGCLLNPSHEKQNDKDDQDDADESDATVTIPVEAATESTEQEDCENDNEDEPSDRRPFALARPER